MFALSDRLSLPCVVQAYFGEAHPFAGAKSPHPATVGRTVQPLLGPSAKPPHPATVGRAGAGSKGASTTNASAAQRRWFAPQSVPARQGAAQLSPNSQAFQTPPGFLEGKEQSPGQELPAPVQRKMEAFFNADFSDVRVHVGGEAQAIGALAFTIGSDLYFAPGQYEPHSARGQELIGHELAHVMQQRAGRVANPFGSGVAVVQDPALEDEANRLGKEVAAQRQCFAPPSGPAQRNMRLSALPPHPAAPTKSAWPEFTAPVQAKPISAKNRPSVPHGSYELVVGAYMHDAESQLPEELAGHSFVALRTPDGTQSAFGFSPARFSSFDPRGDLAQLRAGVAGVVHDDAAALEKPGVKTRSFAISPSEAQAVMAKVSEYQSGKYQFSLRSRQCSTFAEDVLRAAHIAVPQNATPRTPAEVYTELSGENVASSGRSQ